MGKKIKTGKARKDKFYQLAKESGYRSRAAFKLLQLNRRFGFLQRSKVCIDLCAAPGGWCQVAKENMPMSSLVVGVDLVPIKTINGVKTIIADITTEACRTALKRELQSWKADVVLHDGAPNVGKAWVHDEFQQAQLVHQSFKLATEMLRKGGWFITKVFRSQDYDKLKFIMLQLFDQVKAAKPEASRQESAEIYLVCQGFKAPDKIDPAFFDSGRVFGEVGASAEAAERQAHKILFNKRNEYRKAKALGYEDGEAMFQRVKASDFLQSENYLQLLAKASEIVIDLQEIDQHKLTTQEIRECCKDIKVLSKADIKLLINWRKKLLKRMENAEKLEKEANGGDAEQEEVTEQTEEEKIEQQIRDLQEDERKDAKKKLKKVREKKRALHERIQLKMVNPGDQIEQTDDVNLFSLIRVRGGVTALQKLTEDADMPDMPGEAVESKAVNKKVTFEKSSDGQTAARDNPEWAIAAADSASDDNMSDSEDLQKLRNKLQDERYDSEEGMDSDEEMEEEDEEEDAAVPLLQTLEKKEDRASRIEKDWFSQDVFQSAVGDDAEDSSTDTDSESDNDVAPPEARKQAQRETSMANGRPSAASKRAGSPQKADTAEAAPPEKKLGLGKRKLTAEELAVGVRMIQSSKSRRELEEATYHRYMWNDEGQLPDWFVQDEKQHMRRPIESVVSRREIRQQGKKFTDVNARTIKKVAEARERKKRKAERKLERVRKKASTIVDDSELQERERWGQIRQVYKKAGLLGNKKKPAPKLLVAKKKGGLAGAGGKKLPKGVNVKRVDARLKKDTRAQTAGKKGRGRGAKGAKGGKGGKKR